jgi:hypothetical protein
MDLDVQDDVLERLANERSAWFAKLEVAGAEDMTASGFWGEHSLRDLIAHLNGWHAWKNARLLARMTGEEATPPWPVETGQIETDDERVDRINAWLLERAADMPPQQVLAEAKSLWNEQFAIIERMPAELRRDPNAFPMLEGVSVDDAIRSGAWFEHYHDEHGAELARLSI